MLGGSSALLPALTWSATILMILRASSSVSVLISLLVLLSACGGSEPNETMTEEGVSTEPPAARTAAAPADYSSLSAEHQDYVLYIQDGLRAYAETGANSAEINNVSARGVEAFIYVPQAYYRELSRAEMSRDPELLEDAWRKVDAWNADARAAVARVDPIIASERDGNVSTYDVRTETVVTPNGERVVDRAEVNRTRDAEIAERNARLRGL